MIFFVTKDQQILPPNFKGTYITGNASHIPAFQLNVTKGERHILKNICTELLTLSGRIG
jgi:hypothetical protein